jgi:transposase
MRANPKIEQVSIGVGTKGAPAKLSDKRAQEILLILRAGNLDESRYEVLLRDDLKAGNVLVRLVR